VFRTTVVLEYRKLDKVKLKHLKYLKYRCLESPCFLEKKALQMIVNSWPISRVMENLILTHFLVFSLFVWRRGILEVSAPPISAFTPFHMVSFSSLNKFLMTVLRSLSDLLHIFSLAFCYFLFLCHLIFG
jgi:hypothetical protein